MRISTAGLHASALAAILDQQSALAKTQSELSSGKSLTSATDDPLAWAQVQRLDRTSAQNAQFTSNGDAATTRLNLEEQATSDTYTLLQRVRELAVQAGDATQTDSDRNDEATELSTLIDELRGIANRQDGSGSYLFGGYDTTNQPFTTSASGTTYSGDSGQRQLQIDQDNYVADGDSGQSVFMDIRQGNGSFVTGASASNTGSGVIDAGSVTDKSAWVSGNYTLSFSADSTDSSVTDWQATDSSGAVVGSGTYSSGAAITFNGAQVTVSGTPAAGDSFTLTPSGTEDVFTTLQNMLTTLKTSVNGDADRARLSSQLNSSMQQIDQAMNHISDVRTTVGARLNLITTTQSAQSATNLSLQTEISSLQDVDYTTAASQLTLQYTGLQAAQQSYASIAKLSLFNYL